jgi:hypothetical protein
VNEVGLADRENLAGTPKHPFMRTLPPVEEEIRRIVRDEWAKDPLIRVPRPGAAKVYPFLTDCDSLIPTPLATKDLASVMRKVIRIERVNSAEQESGEPLLTPKGYKMADPGGGPDRSRPSHAIFHGTLEGVAAGLQKGLSLWMQEPGKDEALIAANKLRVVYA